MLRLKQLVTRTKPVPARPLSTIDHVLSLVDHDRCIPMKGEKLEAVGFVHGTQTPCSQYFGIILGLYLWRYDATS
jgi:hypothetical protein